MNRLQELFEFVEPVPANLSCYGHAARSLLIEACTELETNLKAILRANGHDGGNTRDYVKLLGPMRLNQWTAQLSHYPDVPPCAPFGAWAPAEPTKSLRWYDSYNAVKHDRERHFVAATLENAIDATIACAILSIAQFGCEAFAADALRDVTITSQPTWALEEEYAPPWLDVHRWDAGQAWAHLPWSAAAFAV